MKKNSKATQILRLLNEKQSLSPKEISQKVDILPKQTTPHLRWLRLHNVIGFDKTKKPCQIYITKYGKTIVDSLLAKAENDE